MLGKRIKKGALGVSKDRIAVRAAFLPRERYGKFANRRLLFGQNFDVVSFRRVERIVHLAVLLFPSQFNDASGDGLGAGGPVDRACFRDQPEGCHFRRGLQAQSSQNRQG